MKCKFCDETMQDLTRGKGAGRNFICQCGAHFYNRVISYWKNLFASGEWFTKKEWEKFVE